MNKRTDFLLGTFIILLVVTIGYLHYIAKLTNNIYSVLDPERVNLEIEVKSNN